MRIALIDDRHFVAYHSQATTPAALCDGSGVPFSRSALCYFSRDRRRRSPS